MANLQALESGDVYTVGWISALPLELAAATAMLDEVHATPTDFVPSTSDQNNYTFGRMGEHNLVIASLPAGVYGTTSAATTASQMLSSFPNIRIGLMVGIGAGIPRLEEYDTRLGDVVVSQHDGLCGGVVQYDLGKAKADGSFERKGMLNRPPLALLNALSNLQARHIQFASKISLYVNKMLEHYPRMKKSRPKTPIYMYQGVENDKLFDPTYLHMGGPSCTACEPAREIPRDARDSIDPEIHYGIIASGNTLVKDAIQRDKLAKDSGEECICFEMEAAGIMNTFPCVVIRGICDYADSHKNDRWQGYAAATAAAYAKELLEVIPCVDLQRTEKAIKILKEVQKTVDNTDKNVEKLRDYASSNKLKEWLHAPDPSTNYNRAIQQRHPGTGLWFTRKQVFERCAGRNEQPSLAFLENVFASMLKQAAHIRVVIDALDESCQQKNTLQWLRRISANRDIAPNKLSVIITSRKEYDIESAFLKWISEKNVLPIKADDVNKDISDFVHSQIQLDPRLERWRDRPDVQLEIESKLIEKANGMFRWVTCQLATLENCLDLRDLRNALDDLPDGLDETYSRILARVDARNQAKAIAMLQLLVWAKRELTLNEFVDALAIRQGEEGLHYDPGNKMPVPNEIAKILPGLIILDTVESYRSQPARTLVRVWVRLAHLSVKEYLTSSCVHDTFKPSLGKLNAHIAIVDMCITHFYNSYPESHVLDALKDSQETDGETSDLPYFVYYLLYWAEHARIAQTDESALKRIVKLLTSGLHPDSPFARCIRFTHPKHPASPIEKFSDMTALFYASMGGLDRVVYRLLEHDAQTLNNPYTYLRLTALGAATQNGHEETVRVLLANGATPMMNTVPEADERSSNETVVALRILKMLLDHGAKPTYLALAYAIEFENIHLVQFLLDNGAPVIDKNNESHPFESLCNTTLLHMACEGPGDIDTVRLILDHGAEIDALDEEHRTALDLAHPEVETFLLDRGADVTASRYKGCTPLHGTVRYARQEEMVSLLDSGADIDAQNKQGQTALHEAVKQAYSWSGPSSSWFVEKLLDRGANALVRDRWGSSALDKVLLGGAWSCKRIEDKECTLRMCSMLSKAMRKQLRFTRAVAKSRRKRPQPLRYKKGLTSRKRKMYGLDFG
ncbi:Pfs, NACHT and ankyrin domain protein, partial [Aureobasidium melanogenum]